MPRLVTRICLLACLLPISACFATPLFNIQTAVQNVGLPLSGSQTVTYQITNNTSATLAGITITPNVNGSPSIASITTNPYMTSCNGTLTAHASCMFTTNILASSSTTGQYNNVTPLVCYAGVCSLSPTPISIKVTSSNSMVCWGQNIHGQFGDDTQLSSSSPVYTLSSSGTTHFTNIQQISGGGEVNHGGFTCAVSTAGAVSCWGDNAYGQTGNGSNMPSINKLPVANTTFTSGTAAITTGYYHVCALKNGHVWCWGGNGSHQVTNGGGMVTTPFEETLAGPAIAIAAGGFHTCALLQNGTVECWGLDQNGQCGDGASLGGTPPPDVYGPTPVVAVGAGQHGASLTNVQAIAAGGYHTCALLTSGKVVCWGANSDGALGNGNYTDQSSPVYVTYARGAQLTGVQSIEAGGGVLGAGTEFTCAALTNGTEYCWGYNDQGQLGIDNTTNYPNPQQVLNTAKTPLSSIQAIMGGDCTNCALLTNGTVRCWGQNRSGEVGNGTGTPQYMLPQTVVRVSPTKNTPGPALTNVTGLFSGSLWSHECAIVGGS